MATQIGKQKYDKGKYVKTDNTDQTVGVNNSLVRSANVNSNENSTVSAASLTKSGSSDEFKFNPAMEQRILAAKDRQAMRVKKRKQNLVGGGDDVKSQFTPTAEEGSKLYEKNLATQNRLNKVDSPKLDKNNLKGTGTPASVKQPISQATDEQKMSAIAKDLGMFDKPRLTGTIDKIKQIENEGDFSVSKEKKQPLPYSSFNKTNLPNPGFQSFMEGENKLKQEEQTKKSINKSNQDKAMKALSNLTSSYSEMNKREEMIKKSLGKSRNEKLNNLLNPNKTFGQ